MRKKKKIKFILIIIAVFAATAFLIVPFGRSKVKPYFSGDAISYRNQVIFATTNTGEFELFKLVNNRIWRVAVLKSADAGCDKFNDCLLKEYNGRLYAYLVNGRYLYQYDISSLSSFVLVRKISNNSGDYFLGLNKINDKICTLGTKGIKIYNRDLVIVNSYNLKPKYADNFQFTDNENYLFYLDETGLKIMDSFYRNIVLTLSLKTADNHARTPYYDNITGDIYVVDDYSLKKIDFNGQYSEFKHISNLGYDVAGIPGRDYIYFSDGLGIVKTRKKDLKPLDWTYTANLGTQDGWAMGLKAISNQGNDYEIIFNGSDIVVLDKNLELVDYYQATEADCSPNEPLSLALNHYLGSPGASIHLYGSGFGLGEELEIKFGHNKYRVKADDQGRFNVNISVPEEPAGKIDIKVDGLTSGLTYSTAFKIIE